MNCKKCGCQISNGESFCPQCGAKVLNSQANTEKICPVCETLNSPTATHCAICGELLPENTPDYSQNSVQHQQGTEQIFCMHCGTPNPDTNSFCLNCGKNLREKPVVAHAPIATPERPKEKSYTPIIIGLVIAAVISVTAANQRKLSLSLKQKNQPRSRLKSRQKNQPRSRQNDPLLFRL